TNLDFSNVNVYYFNTHTFKNALIRKVSKLSIIGFTTIVIIVAILLRGKTIHIIPLIIILIIAALVTVFVLADIGVFFTEGIDKVIDVFIMFIFAILYYGIMQQVGLFDPLINKMVQITQGNVITISIGTVI